MKRKGINSLGNALDAWLSENPERQMGLNNVKACKLFEQRMGMMMKYVAKVECKDRRLHVTLYSSTFRSHLMSVKETLIDYINETIGYRFLTDIWFH